MGESHRTPPVPGQAEHPTAGDPRRTVSTDRLSRRVAASYVAGGAIAAALLLAAGGGVALGQATPESLGHDQPNYYALTGETTQISYATTSLTGLPLLTYQGPFGSHSFTGSDIQQEDTAIGALVMAGPLESIPDLWEVTLTLLVPDVNLVAGGAPTPIATFAILTTHHTSIGGPALVEGALQTYEVVALQGTAQFVIS